LLLEIRTKEITSVATEIIYKHSDTQLKYVTSLTTPETPYANDNTSIQPTTTDMTSSHYEQIDILWHDASDSG